MYINDLFIFTRDLSKQRDFYCNTLGLEALDETETRFSLKMGHSVLHMEHAPNATPYHFAINIPSNQVSEALNWLQQRVKILKDGDKEVQDFTAWNARAMYFYDTDKNIVELIARRDLNNHTDREFGPHAFLAISEIGIPTGDIENVYKLVAQNAGLKIYSGNFRSFCAIGDPNGLLICIHKNAKGWFPTRDTAYPSDFRLSMMEKGKLYQLVFEKGRIDITHHMNP